MYLDSEGKMRLIVVGSSGYVAKRLIEVASSSAEFDCVATSSSKTNTSMALDLRQPNCFDYDAINCDDVIVMCAAISSPDQCKNQYESAYEVNVVGTRYFLQAAIAKGARVIFFSTDTVYGEQRTPVDESQPIQPKGEYGAMKAEVEQIFKDSPAFKSIRLSYIFSKEDKFTQFMQSCAESGEEVGIFPSFDRSIVYREDVIAGVLALAQQWDDFPERILNFGGPDVVSRLALVSLLQSKAMTRLNYQIETPPSGFFDNRPEHIGIVSSIFERLLGRPARSVSEAIDEEFRV